MRLLKAVATDNDISPKAYWIVAPEGTKAGLRIDPGVRQAALMTIAIATSGSSGRYEDMPLEGNGNGDGEKGSHTENETTFS